MIHEISDYVKFKAFLGETDVDLIILTFDTEKSGFNKKGGLNSAKLLAC